MLEMELENNSIKELEKIGWKYNNKIKDIISLEKNLKTNLEKLNNVKLTEEDLERIKEELKIGYIDSKSVLNRRKNLFTEINLKNQNEIKRIKFFDFNNINNNSFEVINQVKNIGKNKNIYDMFLLINGLPLIGIELKKPDILVEEAFGQIIRYSKDSYKNSWFELAELFVISNNIITKIFANNLYNTDFSYKFTYKWKKENSNEYKDFLEFITDFFNKNFIIDYLTNYIIYSESTGKRISLRPYQYYAEKKIRNKTKQFLNNSKYNKQNQKGGIVWHSTGSGKTITSYVTTKNLAKKLNIDKVFFVVDRKDLDIQTINEYKKFDENIETTDKTDSLYKKLLSNKKNDKIIITTIQKLNKLLCSTKKYKLDEISKGKYVFIFDEAHRSNSGKQNILIKKTFKNSIMFGFTGTPIFTSYGNLKTSDEIFGKIIHKYTMTEAIADKNILELQVQYYDFIPKFLEENELEVKNFLSKIITEKDLIEINRYKKIVGEIVNIHYNLTKNRKFNALYVTSNRISAGINYKLLKETGKKTGLKIGLLYNYNDNEYVEGLKKKYDSKTMDFIDGTAREILDEAIKEHDKMFGTNIFQNKNRYSLYTKDVQNKIKNNEYDIVIVANMLLTGFDSPITNTVYIDRSKNIPDYLLIQIISRVNRNYNIEKNYGNVIFFRNLENELTQAIKLYAAEDIKKYNSKNLLYGVILNSTYFKELEKELQEKYNKIKKTYGSSYKILNDLKSKKEQKCFIKDFKKIITLHNKLKGKYNFNLENLKIDLDEFQKFTGIYKEMCNNNKNNEEFKSVLSDIELYLSLVNDIIIDYDYIIKLFKELNNNTKFDNKYQELLNYLEKKFKYPEQIEIIKKFIMEKIKYNSRIEDIDKEFKKFVYNSSNKKLEEIIKKYNLNTAKLKIKVDQCIEKKKYQEKLKEESNCYFSYNYIVENLILSKPKNISFLEINKFYKNIEKELNRFINIYYFYI